MSFAEVKMIDGDVICVEGSLEEVEKVLSDAARSGNSRFAWLTAVVNGERIGVKPDHVVSIRMTSGK